jgi:hypothetical protein
MNEYEIILINLLLFNLIAWMVAVKDMAANG